MSLVGFTNHMIKISGKMPTGTNRHGGELGMKIEKLSPFQISQPSP